jgi:hypothetical protein
VPLSSSRRYSRNISPHLDLDLSPTSSLSFSFPLEFHNSPTAPFHLRITSYRHLYHGWSPRFRLLCLFQSLSLSSWLLRVLHSRGWSSFAEVVSSTHDGTTLRVLLPFRPPEPAPPFSINNKLSTRQFFSPIPAFTDGTRLAYLSGCGEFYCALLVEDFHPGRRVLTHPIFASVRALRHRDEHLR